MGGQSGQFIPTLPRPAAQIGRKFVNYANLNLAATKVVCMLDCVPQARRDFPFRAASGLDNDAAEQGELAPLPLEKPEMDIHTYTVLYIARSR